MSELTQTSQARTHRPVKDNGALMQTSAHLRFSSGLRAVSPVAKPPADSVPPPAQNAPDQERRPTLPNPPRPTSAVGSPFLMLRGGTGGAFALRSAAGPRHRRRPKMLPHPPEPGLARPGPHTAAPGRLAYGDRPGLRSGPWPRRACDLCPPTGTVRGPCTGPLGADGAQRVCGAQTAGPGPHPALPRGGRQDGGRDLQDRALAARAAARARASRRSALGRSGVPVRIALAKGSRASWRGARQPWLSGPGLRFLLPLTLLLRLLWPLVQPLPLPLPPRLPSAGG